MRAILIPVKAFAAAKERLAPHFSQSQRAALAQALCADFFETVAGISVRVFIVSKEPAVLAQARQRGWESIAETEQISESHSVDAGSRFCAERGVTALLRLPTDIPLAEAADIQEIFDTSSVVPCAVIVPSRDGTGTNALLRSPPQLFPSYFGPGSFGRHVAAAEQCGARVHILRNARLGLDIDERDDLKLLAGRLRPGSATARWFAARGFKP